MAAATQQALPEGYTYDSEGNIVASGGTPLMGGQDYLGMPSTPYYNSIYNSSMNLTPQVQSELAGINTSGLDQSVDQFKDMAERQGPSAWATLAGQQQDALMNNNIERGQSEANASTAGAMDQLASSGGLSSGARERAAEAGATNTMNMTQNAGRQNTLNQLQVGVNDQQNKIQELGMLPGMESQALQPEFQKESIWQNAANTNNQDIMAENQNANNYNQNLYNQQMSAWGANQQANATQNSGKK